MLEAWTDLLNPNRTARATEVRSVAGRRQEFLFDERRQDSAALGAVRVPQTRRLIVRQPQPRHLEILHLDATEKRRSEMHRLLHDRTSGLVCLTT